MTANEDDLTDDHARALMSDTSPTSVDLDALAQKYREYMRVDIPGYRRESLAMDLAAIVPAFIAELRSRASIGPDSERIRELEAEVARLRHLAQWVADTFTDEGRDDWWKAWDNADPQKRHRMYVGLACAQ